MNKITEDFYKKLLNHVDQMCACYSKSHIDYMVRNGKEFDLYRDCHLIYGYLSALIKEKVEPIKGN